MSIRSAARALRAGEHAATQSGRVKGVREDYNDKSKVRVDVELPPYPKKKGKGKDAQIEPYRPSADVCVPKTLGLTVGDSVSITTTVKRRA